MFAELQGKPLIFVLKLDEAELVHGVKMERFSITIMNRALDSSIDPESDRYFSIQAEREVWPIAAFQIPCETHAILSWVFNLTKIHAVIKAQGAGQLLEVNEVGSFAVEWHIVADMKTIKAIYGLSQGPNSPQCCIYYNQTQVKHVVMTSAQAEATMNNQKYAWNDGLFLNKIVAKSLFGEATCGCWKPIFDIPLDHVHICVLHAMNMMIEKIVHMHFMHVWTIKGSALQSLAIDHMQKVVSLTGAHGGNVVIFKDENFSGKSNSVPNKPSFSGAHAHNFFKSIPSNMSLVPRKLYVDVVNSERNFLRKGQGKKDHLELWSLLDNLQPYFSGLRLTEDQFSADFNKKVSVFGRHYIKCFGETHVTHYMVCQFESLYKIEL